MLEECREKRETGAQFRSVFLTLLFDVFFCVVVAALQGVSYFQCAPKHGLFVRPRLVEPVSKTVTAQVGSDMSKMKSAMPKLTAPGEAKVACEAFTQWNALDQLEEQEALTTSK